MCTTEVMELLRSEGHVISDYHIYYPLRQGFIPRPTLSRSNEYRWEPEHIDALRAYLASPPKKPGPKRKDATNAPRAA